MSTYVVGGYSEGTGRNGTTYAFLQRKDRDTSPCEHDRYANPVTFCKLLEHVPTVAFVRSRASVRWVRFHEQEHERERDATDGEIDIEAPADCHQTLTLGHGQSVIIVAYQRQEMWSAKAPPIRGPVTEATAKLYGGSDVGKIPK